MIRKATESDLSRLAEIIVYGWRTAYRGILSDEILFKQRTVSKIMDGYKKKLALLELSIDVYDDGVVKGIMTHHEADDEGLSNAYDLMAIYVEPQFKGQGIGTKLLKTAETQAREKGFKTMVMWSLEENAPTLKFYEKYGYARDGGRKYVENWGADIIRLRKEL